MENGSFTVNFIHLESKEKKEGYMKFIGTLRQEKAKWGNLWVRIKSKTFMGRGTFTANIYNK